VCTLSFLQQLHERLDLLALAVRLPGCFNPRCAALGGLSEAALHTKMCAGCRVARYCDAACAKQHWRWHKLGCKQVAAPQ
jgi:hypothetical protein